MSDLHHRIRRAQILAAEQVVVDDLRAREAAIFGTEAKVAPVPASPDWQPIETVPQDGTWVLVTHPDERAPAIARPICPGSVMMFEHFWGDATFNVGPDSKHKWMPLPPPPAETA